MSQRMRREMALAKTVLDAHLASLPSETQGQESASDGVTERAAARHTPPRPTSANGSRANGTLVQTDAVGSLLGESEQELPVATQQRAGQAVSDAVQSDVVATALEWVSRDGPHGRLARCRTAPHARRTNSWPADEEAQPVTTCEWEIGELPRQRAAERSPVAVDTAADKEDHRPSCRPDTAISLVLLAVVTAVALGAALWVFVIPLL